MIKHPRSFHALRAAGFDGVFDWDFLRGAFGRGIMPMDEDGMVETKGNFLIFETKFVDVPMPEGQAIALESEVANNGKTIFFLAFNRGFGNTKSIGDLAEFEIWYRGKEGDVQYCDEVPTLENVKDLAQRWFRKYDREPLRCHHCGQILDKRKRSW